MSLPPPPVELFDAPPETTSFAPGDVIRLLIGIGLVGAGTLVAKVAQESVAGIEADVANIVARLPNRVEDVLLSAAQFVTGLLPTVVLVVLLVRRRWKVALLLFLASFASSLAMQAADGLVISPGLHTLVTGLQSDGGSIVQAGFPSSSVLASSVSVVIVGSQWLSRQWKRALWWLVSVLVLLRLVTPAYPAFDVVLAIGVGTTVGSLVLLLFGSPTQRPGPEQLLAAFESDGWRPRTIEAPIDEGETQRYRFTDQSGVGYEAVLRTPDERDAELLTRLYRGLRFRTSEVGTPFSTLKRRIEHEALMLTLAARAGVRVPAVERIGTTENGSAYYVVETGSVRPAVAADLASPDVLHELWRQVGALHAAGIAHRDLTLEAIEVDAEGRPGLRRFVRSQSAPPERELARDIAELLVETAIEVGADEAVRAAVDELGGDAVGSSLRMLQPLALPGAIRSRARAHGDLLDEVRNAVAAQTAAPALELEEIERIKPKTLVVVAGSAFALYALLPQFANLGATIDAFGGAHPLWIVGAVLASVASYGAASLSFQGSVADPIPFLPVLRSQTASAFAGLVGPAGAGGIALNVRFLERFGVRPSEAGASVTVNTIAGFVVHFALMLGFFVWAGSSDLGGFSLPGLGVLLLGFSVVLAVIGVLAMVGPVRRRVFVPLTNGLKLGLTQIGRVFRNPTRVLLLFGGSSLLSLVNVIGVACCVQAFGGGLTLPQTGAAYLGAVAIATFAPTPGGLGALEAAMIAGLVGFGLPNPVAVSATLTFRLATFWLPLLPGWVMLGHMQRTGEL